MKKPRGYHVWVVFFGGIIFAAVFSIIWLFTVASKPATRGWVFFPEDHLVPIYSVETQAFWYTTAGILGFIGASAVVIWFVKKMWWKDNSE